MWPRRWRYRRSTRWRWDVSRFAGAPAVTGFLSCKLIGLTVSPEAGRGNGQCRRREFSRSAGGGVKPLDSWSGSTRQYSGPLPVLFPWCPFLPRRPPKSSWFGSKFEQRFKTVQDGSESLSFSKLQYLQSSLIFRHHPPTTKLVTLNTLAFGMYPASRGSCCHWSSVM